MTKFNEKSLHSFPIAFFYSALQSFDARIAAVETSLQRFISMRTELHRLFLAFDEAYKQSLKNLSTKTIGDLDKIRDNLAYVMEKVANLWASKLEDDALNIHGRRVGQVFKDFKFRTNEALVAENAKIRNMEQIFAGADYQADLAAMGLTELNRLMAETTAQIEQMMTRRNEEQSTIIVGELKSTREALDAQYRAFITYLNAVQEIQPEEGISQAAQYYNQDLQKVEMQIAQTRKGSSVSPKPKPTPTPTPTPSPTPDPTPDPTPTPTPDPDPSGGGDEGGNPED